MNNEYKWLTLGRLLSLNNEDLRGYSASLSNEEWQAIAVFSVDNLLGPELYCRLRDMGILCLTPEDVTLGLEGAYELNLLLHDDLKNVFTDFLRVSSSLKLTPILLKGGIDIISPYDSINQSRIVSDIDVLLNPENAATLYNRLKDFGWHSEDKYIYNHLDQYLKASHHFPPLWHPTIRQYVEVHSRLGSTAAERELGKYLTDRAEVRSHDGYNYAVPSLKDRLAHNVLHHYRSVFSHTNLTPQSLRQTLDFSRLQSKVNNFSIYKFPDEKIVENNQLKLSLRLSLALTRLIDGKPSLLNEMEFREKFIHTLFYFGLKYRLIKFLQNLALQALRLRNWRNLFLVGFWKRKLYDSLKYYKNSS